MKHLKCVCDLKPLNFGLGSLLNKTPLYGSLPFLAGQSQKSVHIAFTLKISMVSYYLLYGVLASV